MAGTVLPTPPCGHIIVALVVRTCGIAFVLSRYLHHAVTHLENPAAALERDRASRIIERDRLSGTGSDNDFFCLAVLKAQGVATRCLDHAVFQVGLRRHVHAVPKKADNVWGI